VHPVAEEYVAPPWKIGEAYEAALDGGLRVTVVIKSGRSVLYALDGAAVRRRFRRRSSRSTRCTARARDRLCSSVR
jgi:hypothetical protein